MGELLDIHQELKFGKIDNKNISKLGLASFNPAFINRGYSKFLKDHPNISLKKLMLKILWKPAIFLITF